MTYSDSYRGIKFNPRTRQVIYPEEEEEYFGNVVKEFDNAVQRLYVSQISPEATVYPLPSQEERAQAIENWANNNPVGFAEDLRSKGRTPDTEAILIGLGANAKDLDDILGVSNEPTKYTIEEIPSLFQKAMPLIAQESNTDQLISYFQERPDKLRTTLTSVGRNPDTESLVRTIYPQINEQGMNDYFTDVEARRKYLLSKGYTEEGGQAEANLPEPSEGIGFLWDVITGKRTKENPQGLNVLEYAEQFPIAKTAITAIPAVAVLGVASYQALKAATDLLLYSSIMKATSQTAQVKNVAVSKEEAQVFAKQLADAMSKRFSMTQNWKNSFNFARGKWTPKPETVKEAENIAKQAVEKYFPSLIPRGTQSGAMAFGGLPAKPNFIKSVTEWNALSITDRVGFVKSIGLSEEVASKEWTSLTKPEIDVISGLTQPVTPEVTKPIDRNIRWRVSTKTGEAAVTITKEGKYQFTPAYPSTKRQIFDRFEDAIAELRKVGEISEVNMATKTSMPFEPTKLEIGSTAELGIEQGKPFTDDFGHTWTMGKEAGTNQFKLDTVVQGQRISIWARKQSGWQANRDDALAKLKQAEVTPTTPAVEVPPTEPPVTPTVEGVAPEPSNAVDKLIQMVKSAKPAREITEKLKTEELQKRVAVASKVLEAGEGEEAFAKSKGALIGQLPQADFAVDLEAVGMTPADVTELYNMIKRSDLRYFQKLNTSEALKRVFNGQIPTEGDLKLLEDMYGKEVVEALLEKRSFIQKFTENITDILNIPRTLQTIADLSATFRQGIVLAAGQPKQFGKAFVEQIRAMLSDKNAQLIDNAIKNLPHYYLMEQSKLYIAPLGKAFAKVSTREESFMSKLIDKIPVIGQIKRISERTYVSFLNVLRAETFEYWSRSWEGMGKTVKDYKDLASFINHATGRGDLGKLSNMGAILNSAFFSPRFVMSRIQVPLDLFTSTPTVRKVVARNLLAFFLEGMTVLGLAALAGASVELDPRSTDFGKVKAGNTRYDFWGGFQPYVRLVAQLISGERKSTSTSEIIESNRKDMLDKFFRSKLAPIPGLLWDLAEGRTYIGDEFTEENAPRLIFERLSPMFIQDVYDAIEDSGIQAGAIAGIPSALGVGVQTYADNWNTDEDKLGIPQVDPNAPYSVPIVYDVKDYYSDNSPRIGNATTEMLSKKKGIPAKIISVAEAKDVKRQLDSLRGQRLTDLNTDETQGDTYVQYYNQWKLRQQITDEKELKEFDKIYPNAERGNMSQREFAVLSEYLSITDKTKQKEFLETNPELTQNPRTEYLKSHPEDNAKLAIWGQADILTKKAYEVAQNLIKELDIPDSAVAEYLPPKELADDYFDRIETVDKFGTNSLEDKLVRAKNPKLNEFLKLEIPDETVEFYQLKVDNAESFRLLDSFSDKDSPDYKDDTIKDAEGLTERDRARIELYNTKVGDKTFQEIVWTADAMAKGSRDTPMPQEVVDGHLEYNRLKNQGKDVKYKDLEANLFLLGNDAYRESRYNEGIWGSDTLTESVEDMMRQAPRWQLLVDNRDREDKYDAIRQGYKDLSDNDVNLLPVPPDMNPLAWSLKTAEQKREWLSNRDEQDFLDKDNEYAQVVAKVKGYELGLTDEKDVSGISNIDRWVEYSQLPNRGFWRKRYWESNLNFFKAVTDLQRAKGEKPWEYVAGSIPSEEYDTLYDQFEGFRLIEEYKDPESPLYIETEAGRTEAKQKLFNQNPAFKENYIRREGYGLLIPDNYIETYVAFNMMPLSGFSRQRLLKENRGYYDNVYMNRKYYPKGHEEIVFWEIPSVNVENLYNQWQSARSRNLKDNLRFFNRDLDEWLLATGKVDQLIEAEVKLTAEDKRRWQNAKSQEEIDRLLDEIRNKLGR